MTTTRACDFMEFWPHIMSLEIGRTLWLRQMKDNGQYSQPGFEISSYWAPACTVFAEIDRVRLKSLDVGGSFMNRFVIALLAICSMTCLGALPAFAKCKSAPAPEVDWSGC